MFGVALGGGGARGAAHVGVLAALEEAGLRPPIAAGTSAGSLVAALWATGMPAARQAELVERLAGEGKALLRPECYGIAAWVLGRFFGRSWGKESLFSARALDELLAQTLGEAQFDEAGMQLVLPSVSLLSGSTIAFASRPERCRSLSGVVWRRGESLREAVRASCAIPGVFPPARVDGMLLVDGGVSVPLPLELLRAAGGRTLLGVDLDAPYRPPTGRLEPLEIAAGAYEIMRSRITDCGKTPGALILRPELPEAAGPFAFAGMPAFVEAGYRAAKKAMPTLSALL